MSRELSRKEREHVTRRQEILEAALKLFAEKGYHQTSMSEIAKAAEFSIGTLYGFFKNKEELFYMLFNEEIEGITRQVQDRLAPLQNPSAKLEAMLESLFDYFEKRHEAFDIFSANHKTFDSSLKDNLGAMINEKHILFLRILSEMIQQGIEAGVFRPLRPEEMALTFMGLVNGSILLWLESGRKYSIRERVPELMEIFRHGVEK